MNKVLGEYRVTGKGFPDWLKQEMLKGRVVVDMEDDEFLLLKLFTPSGVKEAKKGDMVMLLKSGMVVVPQEAARKYMGVETGEK